MTSIDSGLVADRPLAGRKSGFYRAGRLYRRIVAGNDVRKTRLHTEQNELIPLVPAAQDLLGTVAVKLKTSISGRRPVMPWWPTRVIPLVETFLKRDMDAIEFGSGSSSIWIAQRVRSLLSVDDNPAWARTTAGRLAANGLANATVKLASGEDYWSVGAGRQFDFAVVDGSWRWKCIEDVLPRMRSGGLVYFDNADADKDARFYTEPGQRQLAQARLQAYARATPGANLVKVRSFIHGELHAGEGWLLWIP